MHLSWGTIHDFSPRTTRAHLILERKTGCALRVQVVHEGHSWGQWRAQGDDVLRHLFGTGG